MVISSYSDLSKISPCAKSVHFRKFVSKRLLSLVVQKCRNLQSVSVSKYAYRRLVFSHDVDVKISGRMPGRPSAIERLV